MRLHPELYDIVSLCISLDLSPWQVLACQKGCLESLQTGSWRIRVLRQLRESGTASRVSKKVPQQLTNIARRIYLRDNGILLTSFKNSDDFFESLEAATAKSITREITRQEKVYDSCASTLIVI